MDVVSFFAGCGGLDLGFEQAGFHVVWAKEFEPSVHATYEKNQPDTILCKDDITTVDPTASNSLLFTIKHDQLFSVAGKNYLIAIVLELEKSNAGRTLEEIITGLLDSPDYCNGLQFSINLEKEKRRVSPIDAKHKRFVLRKVYAYPASNINLFGDIPDCVEDLSYKIDLLPFKAIPIADILP